MKLEEIRKLCEEATPGPWNGSTLRGVIDLNYSPEGHCTGITWLAADAYFIAAARTLLPKLLAVAEAAQQYFTEDLENGDSFNHRWFKSYSKVKEALAALEAET